MLELKSLLRQGLSEPELYGDLVYELKKLVGSHNFSMQLIKISSHYKKIGYFINVLQQTACLVVNPIRVQKKYCLGTVSKHCFNLLLNFTSALTLLSFISFSLFHF